ncbi:MAG: VOC family protein [Proteobacteria bacterium]|nr:VOC family protein [Pseudomonadota bacterium]
MFKKVAFTMYPVQNMERARRFYEKTLGLTTGSVTANGAWVEYDLPGGGCLAITTLLENLKPSHDSGGKIAFEVENLDLLVEQLKAAEVQFKVDVCSSPVCKMAVILDSEGNGLILHQITKK